MLLQFPMSNSSHCASCLIMSVVAFRSEIYCMSTVSFMKLSFRLASLEDFATAMMTSCALCKNCFQPQYHQLNAGNTLHMFYCTATYRMQINCLMRCHMICMTVKTAALRWHSHVDVKAGGNAVRCGAIPRLRRSGRGSDGLHDLLLHA